MENTTKHDSIALSTARWRTLATTLLAGLCRLAFVSALGGCLLLVLVNEIVTTLVYTIAAALTLFFGSCLH